MQSLNNANCVHHATHGHLHCLQLLQLVNHLRRHGFFVGVALTRPFRFEGARRMEQADALIEIMEEVASLTVSTRRIN